MNNKDFMPNLRYHENTGEDINALQKMGSTFSDAVIGMAAQRNKQEQLKRQQMMEQQYLAIAQQKAREGSKNTQSEIDYRSKEGNRADATTARVKQQIQQAGDQQARAQMLARLKAQYALGPEGVAQNIQDPRSGPQMMGDLKSVGALPNDAMQIGPNVQLDPKTQLNPNQLVQRLLAAIQGGTYGTAASSPSSAARLVAPVIMRPGTTGNDQVSGQPMMQGPPVTMTPYQQIMTELAKQREQRTGSLGDRGMAERERHDKAMEGKQKAVSAKTAMQERIASELNAPDEPKSDNNSSNDEFTLMLNPKGLTVKVPKGAKVPPGYEPVQ